MNIFITGRPGMGKSTLIQQLIEGLKGRKIAGIISPEIRSGERRGFKMQDLVTRREEIFASVDFKSGPRIGKYTVNVRAIDNMVASFLQYFELADYVFLDEIGKMEFCSDKFKKMVNRIIKTDKIIIAAISKDLSKKFKRQGEVFQLERKTFKDIKAQILQKIA
jgi:nucleoside-triphosphatase